MRARSLIFIAVFGAVLTLPDIAQAQFSPRGIINQFTGPLRHMLRRHQYPRYRRAHRAPAAAPQTPIPSMASTAAQVGARLGWVGPATWPSAYEDVLGFAFTPDDYAAQLRGHGFDVIANTIVGRSQAPRAPAATTGTAVRDDDGDACKGTTAQDNWPAARVEQIAELSGDQNDALKNLQIAVDQSVKTIRANCRDTSSRTAPDRLKVLVRALWTVHDAGIFVRTPVKTFYASLNETQQTKFTSQQPQANPAPDAQAANPAANPQYQACAAQNIEPAERLIKLIEASVRPKKDQRPSLQKLHTVSSNMAKLLMASCAQPIAADPLKRLDAAADQLTAMNYAATTFQIAFNDFYARLDNSQKARLNALGR